MKPELIVTLMLTGLCLGERRQRSTVLTDESKRVLEQFDFSNFDKQEALNNIERQRYENQIRGKRSKTKFKKDGNDYEESISDVTQTEDPEKYLQEESNYPKKVEEGSVESETRTQTESPHNNDSSNRQGTTTMRSVRSRVGRRSKKKHKLKTTRFVNSDENKEGEKKNRRRRRKKRRKKKKKKKRKRRYWNEWSEWSPCSVTCGRGRKIRWRKCIVKNCNRGELEMGEKTCQLPACNLLTKLLGL